MQLNKSKIANNNLGFTLLELLVVLAIIASIGAIGVPAYMGYISDARDKAAQSSLQSIVLMQKNYYQDTFCYVVTGTGDAVGPDINFHLFGTPEAEKTLTPIDTTIKNFFYFEITGDASTACPASGTPMLGKNFTVKAIKRLGAGTADEEWFSINHKLTKLDQDGNTW
tara:strand:- start:747 stop:1250 length:504 start_codon:yes stop_codon:yes gene_type:complete